MGTTEPTDNGRGLLRDLLGAYRRMSSRPPKGTQQFNIDITIFTSNDSKQTFCFLFAGFEKYFPESHKTPNSPKNPEAEAAAKGKNC